MSDSNARSSDSAYSFRPPRSEVPAEEFRPVMEEDTIECVDISDDGLLYNSDGRTERRRCRGNSTITEASIRDCRPQLTREHGEELIPSFLDFEILPKREKSTAHCCCSAV